MALSKLVVRYGDRFLHPSEIFVGQLRRPEIEGQLVDGAVEGERYLVVVLVYGRASVDTDVEGLIGHLQERDRVRLLMRVDDLAIHFEHTRAPLGDAGAVIRVVVL